MNHIWVIIYYIQIAKVTSIQSHESKFNLQGHKDLSILFSELAELLTAGNDFKGLILKKLQIKNQTIRKEYKPNNDKKPKNKKQLCSCYFVSIYLGKVGWWGFFPNSERQLFFFFPESVNTSAI